MSCVIGFGDVAGTSGEVSYGELGVPANYRLKSTVTASAFALTTFGGRIGSHTRAVAG
jgi:hypothetical protein